MTEPLDRIYIRDLQVRCIIGVYDHERKEKQDVRINLTLHADLRRACQSDELDDTVDYKQIKKRIYAMAEGSSFYLVERLAEEVADICLQAPRVEMAEVTVDKPGALRFAHSVAVHIVRRRGDGGDA